MRAAMVAFEGLAVWAMLQCSRCAACRGRESCFTLGTFPLWEVCPQRPCRHRGHCLLLLAFLATERAPDSSPASPSVPAHWSSIFPS